MPAILALLAILAPRFMSQTGLAMDPRRGATALPPRFIAAVGWLCLPSSFGLALLWRFP